MSDPTDPVQPDLPPPGADLPPTEAMPTTPAGPAAAATGAGVAGGDPGGPADTEIALDDGTPWYKKPGGIVAIVIAIAAILGLLAWLIWGGGDDDEPEPGLATLELTTVDLSGATLDRAFVATVEGPTDAPDAFEWVLPSGGTGAERGSTTGDDGEITFSWTPDATVEEPSAWPSRITLIEQAPAGFVPPGPTVDCVLERIDEQNTTISMNAVADPPDSSVDQFVTYTFPNHVFLPGDLVTCELVSEQLPTTTTTTVPETTTTVPETTTTVPETTTTVPETTLAPTTLPPETTVPETTTTVAPQPPTVREALEADGNYTTFLALAATVQSVQDLLDGPGPITVFAPTDDALEGVTPPADPDELEALLLSHIVDGESLDSAAVLDGRTEITVATGGTQPVDPDAGTVGGVIVVQVDLGADAGFAHGLDGVMAPAPAP